MRIGRRRRSGTAYAVILRTKQVKGGSSAGAMENDQGSIPRLFVATALARGVTTGEASPMYSVRLVDIASVTQMFPEGSIASAPGVVSPGATAKPLPTGTPAEVNSLTDPFPALATQTFAAPSIAMATGFAAPPPV